MIFPPNNRIITQTIIINIIIDKCYEELPDYEVPSYFEEIEKIPYTPNEKRDFRALEELGNKIVKERKGKVLTKKF